jgi:flagellar biosynthetic protein FliR
MPGDLTIPLTTLYGFLLAFARISGVFVFVPIPGLRAGPAQARVILILAITTALSGSWPVVSPEEATIANLTGWVLWESMLGLGVGLAVSFITEALGVAAQIISLQSGYAFSSTIDPNTNADSTALIILSQLVGGLLFFTLGLDRQFLAILARTLETYPPSLLTVPMPVAEQVLSLGSMMFTTGLRLALPVAALLVLIDVSTALIGRLNAHLQLLAMTFPAKMMVAMVMLSTTLLMYTKVFSQQAKSSFGVIQNLLGR